jgi:hypothetical protein
MDDGLLAARPDKKRLLGGHHVDACPMTGKAAANVSISTILHDAGFGGTHPTK